MYLGEHFNHPLDNLSESLKRLIFRYNSDYSYSFDNLPRSLTHLQTGIGYNIRLDNLPNSLTHLGIYDENFNHPLDNLPNGLIRLDIDLNFNHPINNLPNTLKELYFSRVNRKFSQSIDQLPDSIEKLCLPIEYNLAINNLPTNLKFLVHGDKIPNIDIIKQNYPNIEFRIHDHGLFYEGCIYVGKLD